MLTEQISPKTLPAAGHHPPNYVTSRVFGCEVDIGAVSKYLQALCLTGEIL
jgi:hypothetical protein